MHNEKSYTLASKRLAIVHQHEIMPKDTGASYIWVPQVVTVFRSKLINSWLMRQCTSREGLSLNYLTEHVPRKNEISTWGLWVSCLARYTETAGKSQVDGL